MHRWIERAREGSLSSFASVVQLFQGRVFNFHLRRLGCAADAEDLTQDTFVRAWQRLDRYDPSRRFSTWLFTIAARQSASLIRSRRRRRTLLARRPDPAAASGPEETTDVRDEADHVWRRAQTVLSADQRAALWLRYFEGLDVGEIASILGRRRVATRVMLFRAREKLAAAVGAGPARVERGERAPRQGPLAACAEGVR